MAAIEDRRQFPETVPPREHDIISVVRNEGQKCEGVLGNSGGRRCKSSGIPR